MTSGCKQNDVKNIELEELSGTVIKKPSSLTTEKENFRKSGNNSSDENYLGTRLLDKAHGQVLLELIQLVEKVIRERIAEKRCMGFRRGNS